MDTETLPFYFENLSATDEELVNKNFGRSSSARGLGRVTQTSYSERGNLNVFSETEGEKHWAAPVHRQSEVP